jgi:serine/threonine protein kinase
VLLVKKNDTGVFYALKILKKALIIQTDQVQHTITEKNVLQQINHPFIVNLRYAFQSERNLYLVLDFANGGDLFFHLKKVFFFFCLIFYLFFFCFYVGCSFSRRSM